MLVGSEIAGQIRAKLGDMWDELPRQAREDIASLAEDYPRLLLARMGGQDVERQMLHLEAQIANWSFRGEAAARRVVLDVLSAAAQMAGEFLSSVVLRLWSK